MRLSRASRPVATAFTLIELLVVIAIIAILLALILPAINAVRASALNTQCKNNLKQLGLACNTYLSSSGTFPAGSITYTPAGGTVGTYDTWSITLLPYIEQGNLFALWTPQTRNDDPGVNMTTLRTTMIPTYSCPADPNGKFQSLAPATSRAEDNGTATGMVWMTGSYRCVSGVYGTNAAGTAAPSNDSWDDYTNVQALLNWNAGWRGAMHAIYKDTGAGSAEGPGTITDGLSNTLLIGEYTNTDQANRRTLWAYAYTSYNQSTITQGQPETLLDNYNGCTTILNANDAANGGAACKRGWGSAHPQGSLNFVMCDGSVRAISTSIDMTKVMPALGTIAGGETAANLAP